jgi:hypothetical protein
MNSHIDCRHVFAALLITMPLFSLAQTVPMSMPMTPPATAHAAQADDAYQSAFTDYKSDQDDEKLSWRSANDVVGGAEPMDGHNMDNMKSMSAPASAKNTASEPGNSKDAATVPLMMDHSGMKKQ